MTLKAHKARRARNAREHIKHEGSLCTGARRERSARKKARQTLQRTALKPLSMFTKFTRVHMKTNKFQRSTISSFRKRLQIKVNEIKYSRMDQVKFLEDSLEEVMVMVCLKQTMTLQIF